MSGRVLFLVVLLGPVFAQEAAANACESASSCGAAPCDFDAAGSWTSCGGTFPQLSDTWTVRAGHTVVLDTVVMTRAGFVAGTLRTVPGTATLTILGSAGNDLFIGVAGVVRMRRGDSLLCDSTEASCEYFINSGGLLDLQGDVHETRVAAAVVDAAAVPICGTTTGRHWTFDVESGASFAAAGGRVRFLSGKARNREFEIVGVSGSAVSVCTDLDDAMSVSHYGGHRLTPHVPVGVLRTRHSVPTVSDDTSPFYAVPVAGDRVALIQDVTLRQTGGSNGFRIQGPASGMSAAPIFRAVHFDGLGVPGEASIHLTAARAGQSAGTIEYIHLHDYAGTDQISIRGWQNTTLRYIHGHDAGPGAGESSGVLVPQPALLSGGGQEDLPADGTNILDSTFYRTRGNAINFNVASTTVASTGNVIRGVLVFEGCTTPSGECGGIEVNACQFCEVSHNVVHDICRADGTNGSLLRFGGQGSDISQGLVAHHNWLVNGCGDGVYIPLVGRGVTLTANYISHVRLNGGFGGRYFGNVIRNWGLDNTGRRGLSNPHLATGNWLLGNDASIGEDAACGAACARYGVFFDASGAVTAGEVPTITDLFVGGLDGTSGRGVAVDDNTDFGVDIDQVSCHNYGGPARCINIGATSTIPVRVSDVTAENTARLPAIQCSTGAIDSIGNLLYDTDTVGVSTIGCDSIGAWTGLETVGHRDPAGGDFNFVPDAPGLTLAEDGGPIGLRAFRAPYDALNAFWGGLLPFDLLQPVDVSNSPNEDSDGDGVLDLHDSCDRTWNPSQHAASCPPGPCFGEACDGGLCVPFSMPDGASCDDACSGGTAVCRSGVCTGATPVSCEDENPCTVDSCDPVAGCSFTPVVCDDGNTCTEDSCSPAAGGCVHAPMDAVPCSVAGVGICHTSFCREGACTGLAPISCDDGYPYNVDSCDSVVGCLHSRGLRKENLTRRRTRAGTAFLPAP